MEIIREKKFALPDFKFFLENQILSYLIIAFGVAVRLVQYLSNRSLWADEAVLALNIVNRSYLELFQSLDYDQGAPIGFLMVEKLAVQILGNNEYALRLFPFICGVGSLFVFYELAKKWIPKSAIPIGLILFASLEYLVYYSAEVKQYSSDVAIALLLYLLLLPLVKAKLNFGQMIRFGLVGAIAIWFSHPSIFILASIGGSALLINLWQKDLSKVKNLLLIYSAWVLSFVIFYFVSLRNLTGNETLTTSWGDGFPNSIFDIVWMFDAFGKFFYKPLGFTKWMDGLAIILFFSRLYFLLVEQKGNFVVVTFSIICNFFSILFTPIPISESSSFISHTIRNFSHRSRWRLYSEKTEISTDKNYWDFLGYLIVI